MVELPAVGAGPLARPPLTSAKQHKAVATGAQAAPGLLIYRFTHSMYYANSQQLAEEVIDLVNQADPPIRWLCLDASAVDDVDYSAAGTLRSLFATLKEKGVRLVVAQVLDDVRERARYKLRELYGEDAFYDTLDDVVEDFRVPDRGSVNPSPLGDG